jgi:hypothetical protein
VGRNFSASGGARNFSQWWGEKFQQRWAEKFSERWVKNFSRGVARWAVSPRPPRIARSRRSDPPNPTQRQKGPEQSRDKKWHTFFFVFFHFCQLGVQKFASIHRKKAGGKFGI